MEDKHEKIPIPLFEEKVIEAISKRWCEQFPDDFIKCNTLDENVYNSTKDFAYHTRTDILNHVGHALGNNPDYKVTDADGYKYGIDFQIEQQQKMLYDIENCDNIKLWCIDNIGTH